MLKIWLFYLKDYNSIDWIKFKVNTAKIYPHSYNSSHSPFLEKGLGGGGGGSS